MKTIRIGTRDSELALWQANKVRKMLEELGYQSQNVGRIRLSNSDYSNKINGGYCIRQTPL